jgi:hypothetical protein
VVFRFGARLDLYLLADRGERDAGEGLARILEEAAHPLRVIAHQANPG